MGLTAYAVGSTCNASLFVPSVVARFQVQRIGGLFREVSVPYEVELGGRSDLAPPTGSVVFLPNQNEAVSGSLTCTTK